MKKNSVLSRVLIAIILAVIAGLLTGPDSGIFGIAWVRIYNLIGQLFLNALTLVVVPLVASSIITGSARIGQEKEFGKLGFRTFFFFILTSLIAVLIGFTVASIGSPGTMIDANSLKNLTGSNSLAALEQQASGSIFDKVEQILFRMIPSNIISVAAQGQMLGIIFFALVFGFFSSRIEPSLSNAMIKFWKGTFEIMMLMTHFIMKALPIGVFGLMAKVVATTGLEAMKPVSIFFICVITGLLLFMFVALPLLLKIIGGVNPFKHFKTVTPALITAFSTSSTAATLPVTIDCMEKKAGIPNRICSFVLPLGTSLNLAGSALYATTAVIFISQAYGLEMNAATLITVILMCLFTGLGMVAGIPSASLITIVIILQAIGLPSDGIVLVLAVERILDMCRTTASVFSNTCCASLVYHLD